MPSKLALAAAIGLAAAAPAPQKDNAPLIVGGELAEPGEFPYIVSLQQGGSHFCGGVLLSADRVVTAAHCSDVSAGSVTVVGGTNVSCIVLVINPKVTKH